MSTFYVVKHAFKLGCAEKWWGTFAELAADAEKFTAWTAKTHEMGFHNHTFLPSGMTSNAFCVWEVKEGITGAEFQTFVDGEYGPSFGVLMNECFPVRLDLAGNPPFKSYFAAEPAAEQSPPAEVSSDSSFYIIHHSFKAGKAAEWWGAFAKLAAEPEKMATFQQAQVDAGFYGHAFMPTGEQSDCFCLWEAAAGKTTEDMQDFIDGPVGPSFGCFSNAVVPIDLSLCNGAPELERKFSEYTVTARFFAAEGKMEELSAIFKEALRATAEYDGCELIEMYTDPAQPNEFVLWEKWASKAHHQRYMQFRTETGFFEKVSPLFSAPPAIQPLRRTKDGESRVNVRATGFTVLAKFVAKEGHKAELFSTIAEALKCTHKYEGNLAMEQFGDDAEPNAMYLWEQWDKEETFKAYFQMRVDTGFIAKVMPMLEGPPAPMPLVAVWQPKASTPKLKMERAKAVDKKFRLASPHHAPAVAPLSPMNREA